MACQSLWGMSHFNSKILHFKQCKKLKFLGQKEESTKNGKLWPLYGRFSTLTWRPGDTVQYLESPGLSGRVDSLAFRTNMKTIWYSMNTYPICVSPLSTSAHCRFAPLQNSCQNHCSHRCPIQYGFWAGAKAIPYSVSLRNECRNFILMTRQYPDPGSAFDWLCCSGNLIQPTRGTTQIWVVTRHQYGISALVSETLFGGNPVVTSPNVGCFLRLL